MYEITILELDENGHGIGDHRHQVKQDMTLMDIEFMLSEKYNRFTYVSLRRIES